MEKDNLKSNIKGKSRKKNKSKDASDTVYLGRIYSLLDRIEGYGDWIHNIVDEYGIESEDELDMSIVFDEPDMMCKNSYVSYLRRLDRSIEALERLVSPDIQYKSRKTMEEKEYSSKLLEVIMSNIYNDITRHPIFFEIASESDFYNIKKYLDKAFTGSASKYLNK